MSENNSSTDINKYLFINLVTMLGITAMQQLGKIINPAVGKAAVNLEAAQATIDTLDMLSAKTDGKLDHDEARLLKDTLSALKMNYVETKEMQKAEGRMKNGKPEDTAPKGPKDTAVKPEPPVPEKSEESEPKTGPEQSKDPKFHKSYD